MKNKIFLALFILISVCTFGQSNNPLSIYEGYRIQSIKFDFAQLPSDTLIANECMQKVERAFKLYPQTQYSAFMALYYVSQVKLLSFVENAELNLMPFTDNGVEVILRVRLFSDTSKVSKNENIFKNIRSFPVIYSSERAFITTKFASAEMLYTNNNAWFAQPTSLLDGNPLVHHPQGAGYAAWLEGFASLGFYGVVKIFPKINLSMYGGINYLVSFSVGPELFTNKARFYGDIEEAYGGFISSGRTKGGHLYYYNILYGRKQFTLGDGFLIVNTSMNGDNKAALQLNPRWAAQNIFQAGFAWDRLAFQIFRFKPNELPILNSHTLINGLNLELGNKDRMLIAASFLQVPQSTYRYYLPDGTVHTRDGLQVYNLRIFRNAPIGKGGFFFKAEGAYERNANFKMSAWAYYGEIGWRFATTKTMPMLSYRYATFSGDNPNTKSYNRWDALYTGGNGEQWVQGSNMYKIVQNSNEISHRLQLSIAPIRKLQLVGQVWLFYAPQKMNLGGNPALSILKSKIYGSEYNLTVKFFYSRHWYFHLNTAYTLPGNAIREVVSNTKNWFCLSVFARYSF
ncbi:MAG: alginate export family protein [Bacteroidales bacterium]